MTEFETTGKKYLLPIHISHNTRQTLLQGVLFSKHCKFLPLHPVGGGAPQTQAHCNTIKPTSVWLNGGGVIHVSPRITQEKISKLYSNVPFRINLYSTNTLLS